MWVVSEKLPLCHAYIYFTYIPLSSRLVPVTGKGTLQQMRRNANFKGNFKSVNVECVVRLDMKLGRIQEYHKSCQFDWTVNSAE
jgi:hypothetical protein